MIKATLAVAGKELTILLKDRGALAVLFLLPLVLASVFGSISRSLMDAATGDESTAMPLLVVNQDGGPYGRQILTTLEGIAALEVTASDPATDSTTAGQLVIDGDALAAVIIPTGFSERVDAYEPSTIQVLVDPTEEESAGLIAGILNEVVAPVVLQGEIQYGIRSVMDQSGLYDQVTPDQRRAMEAQSLGAIMTQLQRQQQTPWIEVREEGLAGIEPRPPYDPFSYTVPSFTAMFAFFLVGVMAQSLWLEKEQGSLRRLLAAPIHRGAIIAGKMVAYMVMVVLQVVVFFAVGSMVFGMSLGRSVWGLVLLTLGLAMSAAGLGMLLATLVRSSRQADSIGMVLGFVLAAAGGCIGYPLFLLPGLPGIISRLTPHAHAIMGYLSLFQGGNVGDILPQAGILAGMGILFFGLAMWRFRFE